MIVWILYDIENDKVRNKIAKLCKQAGLYRVQLSVFVGTLEKSEKDALQLQIRDLINEEKDKVYVFTMSKDELRECVFLGQAFDKKLITDEVMALIF